jgi:hypothetical protein
MLSLNNISDCGIGGVFDGVGVLVGASGALGGAIIVEYNLEYTLFLLLYKDDDGLK